MSYSPKPGSGHSEGAGERRGRGSRVVAVLSCSGSCAVCRTGDSSVVALSGRYAAGRDRQVSDHKEGQQKPNWVIREVRL